MRVTKWGAIVMVVVPLVLFVIQAGIWIKSTSHASSQTVIVNRESQHRPSEIAGIAGMLLLIAEGTILSIPRNDSMLGE